DGAVRRALGDRPEDALAAARIARPLVHRNALLGPQRLVVRRHHHLLPQHLPARARFAEPVDEPAFLLRPEDRTRGIVPFAAGHVAIAVVAGLVVAVLARVEHPEAGQRAPVGGPADVEVRPRP